MRTLRNLGLPQDGNNALFPDGQIRNETITETGTPVVRQVYGDLLTNIYKIIRDSGLIANELEDSEVNGYQLLRALKVFTNELNDLRQVITVGVDTLQVNFDLDNLPDNYVFLGKLSDNFIKGVEYTLTGSGNFTYTMTANESIKASSQIIVVLNQSQVEVISLSGLKDYDALLTPFSGVLSFNSTNKVHYLSDGWIITNVPESYNVQQTIRVAENDNDITVYDAVIHKNKLIVMAKKTSETSYKFYVFELDNLTTIADTMNYDQSSSTDFIPTLYAGDDFLYLTNNGNKNSNDSHIAKIEFDDVNLEMSDVSDFTLDVNFQKTTNAFVRKDSIITLIGADLIEYLPDGGTAQLGFFNNVNGQIFKQNEQVYFTSGEIAMPWNV